MIPGTPPPAHPQHLAMHSGKTWSAGSISPVLSEFSVSQEQENTDMLQTVTAGKRNLMLNVWAPSSPIINEEETE